VNRPLEGLRVVDAATILAGPFAASILGEFGADVVKVEQPGIGDPMRRLGTAGPGGDTWWWLSDTRNKVSVELDLRTDEGAGRFRDLVASSDVLVENYRSGTMERWGLGFETLRLSNPGLVQLSISGFGRTGPMATRAGVARIAEAFTGMAHLTGEPDGAPGLSGSSGLADYVAGLYGALGVLLAVRARDASGRGQLVDVALYDGIARILDELVPVHVATGAGRERMGPDTHRSVPHSNYRTTTGDWVTIACTNDRMFDRLAEVMGRSDLLDDERFATNAGRIANREEVNMVVGDWVATTPLDEVIAGCEAAAVPVGLVQTVGQYLEHPQVAARDSVVTIDHPTVGPVTVSGVVPHLVDTPGLIETLGAVLGGTTVDEVLERWRGALDGATTTGGTP
jgi:crotonobetainyl-CoA:carnitine CoA-transferase CaiB-like acyl-CoA transferase